MTSWFIGVKASVISGAPLYSKSISYLFPVGKRQVLFAKRLIYREVRVRTRTPATKKRPAGADRFQFYAEHLEGVSELIFSLPFMLSKHRSTSAASYFEDLPCLSLLLMSVWK